MKRLVARTRELAYFIEDSPSLLTDDGGPVRVSTVPLPTLRSAEAFAAGCLAAAAIPPHARTGTLDWINARSGGVLSRLATRILHPPPAEADAWSRVRQAAVSLSPATAADDALYERLLASTDREARRHGGIYFTPAPVAACVVREVDRLWEEDLGLTGGLASLASGSGALRLLDPAAGTGVFLIQLLERIDGRLRDAGCAWSSSVARRVLALVSGYELHPAAALVAQFRLAAFMAERGLVPSHRDPMPVTLRDALAAPPDGERPFNCIVGNPPYSSLSTHDGRWMLDLMRGKRPESPASYYEVDGRPLGEKKLWLHDAYVKFFRLAQWHLDQVDRGVVAWVSNHGYLDNVTFRGMRQQLLRTFPRVSIVDLHGNRKKSEVADDNTVDESVFETEQGAALVFFCRGTEQGDRPRVRYAGLRGARDLKLSWCAAHRIQELPTREFHPQGPDYLMVPRNEDAIRRFRRGTSINEVMPFSVSAPVTARDRLVVALDRDALRERMIRFRDPGVPDQDLREEFFIRPRSRRYPRGDTRSWKLATARRTVAQDPHWEQPIRECDYRPWDRRWIYWSPSMIDWPRPSLAPHLKVPENLFLITRRQMLPGKPCNYFWVTRGLPLDGILRSDNRGSETMFPLWCWSEEGGRQPNLDPRFTDRLSTAIGRHRSTGPEGSAEATRCEDVLAFVYAQFHLESYREPFADGLRMEFPRVFLPRDPVVFERLSQWGRRLIGAHLLEFDEVDEVRLAGSDTMIAARHPAVRQGRVYINVSSFLEGLAPQVLDFQAGAHRVVAHWLAARRGTHVDLAVCDRLGHMSAAVRISSETVRACNAFVQSLGGWDACFLGNPERLKRAGATGTALEGAQVGDQVG